MPYLEGLDETCPTEQFQNMFNFECIFEYKQIQRAQVVSLAYILVLICVFTYLLLEMNRKIKKIIMPDPLEPNNSTYCYVTLRVIQSVKIMITICLIRLVLLSFCIFLGQEFTDVMLTKDKQDCKLRLNQLDKNELLKDILVSFVFVTPQTTIFLMGMIFNFQV